MLTNNKYKTSNAFKRLEPGERRSFVFKAGMRVFGSIAGIVAVLGALPAFTVHAEQAVMFSVMAIQSEKQINKNLSYFDLLLSPGEEHTIEIEVFNNADKPMKAEIAAYTAGTNPGGVIDYDSLNDTDDSLKASFEEAATVETPFITVPAAGSDIVRINIKMPNEPFDGIMLGGIEVKKAESEYSETIAEGSGTSVQNEYRYIICAKIRMNDTPVEPDLRLRSVEPALANYRTGIIANIQNYRAAIAKDVEIDASIYYENAEQPLYSKTSRNFDIAPNSSFDYVIPCSDKLSAGNYRLVLTAAHGEKLWKFEEPFAITKAAASNINGQAVNSPPINYYLIATTLLSVFFIVVAVFIIIRIIIAHKRKRKISGNRP